jgi:hypothetical protein
MLGAGVSGGRATGRPLLKDGDGLGAAGAAARAAGFAAAFRGAAFGAAFGALCLAVARFAVVRLAVAFFFAGAFFFAVLRFAVDFLPPARFAVDRLAVDFLDDFFFAGISPPFGYAMFHRAWWFVRMRTADVTCEL